MTCNLGLSSYKNEKKNTHTHVQLEYKINHKNVCSRFSSNLFRLDTLHNTHKARAYTHTHAYLWVYLLFQMEYLIIAASIVVHVEFFAFENFARKIEYACVAVWRAIIRIYTHYPFECTKIYTLHIRLLCECTSK